MCAARIVPLIGERLAHFEITAKLGEGGMGEVYRARDTKLGRDVAIKLLLRDVPAEGERLRRFEQEVLSTSSLNHPNILTVYEVGEPGSPEGFIRIEPDEGLSVSYLLDYPEPIGTQSFEYVHRGRESFRREIAPARTFGFIWELESLERMGLGEGGRWGNVILVDHERVVNTELRFPDEFARHKVLDLIGDLYLAGRPIRGRVTAERTGHRHNVALVRLLSEAYR